MQQVKSWGTVGRTMDHWATLKLAQDLLPSGAANSDRHLARLSEDDLVHQVLSPRYKPGFGKSAELAARKTWCARPPPYSVH